MLSRSALLLGLAAVSAAVLPAGATPVEQTRSARVLFDVAGDDGLVQNVALSAVAGRLTVDVQHCEDGGCWGYVGYEGPVPGSFSVDPSAAVAHLRVSVGGRQLVVDWSPVPAEGPAVAVGGLSSIGNGDDNAADVYRGDAADVRVQLGGVACRTSGLVGDQARVSVPDGSGGARGPLRRLRLLEGPPSCDG